MQVLKTVRGVSMCAATSMLAVVAAIGLSGTWAAVANEIQATGGVQRPLVQGGFEVVRQISVQKPAFLRTLGREDGSISLYVSSFGLMKGGEVFELAGAESLLDAERVPKIQTIVGGLKWPNEVNQVDFPATFGSGYVTIGDGFLVPTKQTGGVVLLHRDSGETFEVSRPKKGWFYHRAVTTDWDGDGDQDLLSARSLVPMFGGSPKGELVLFENPGHLDAPWSEKVIAVGPDVMFELEDFDDDGLPEIVAAQFFSRKLAVYKRESLTQPLKLVYADDTVGKAFDVSIADLNGDGRRDIMLTNHEDDERAAVFAYEVPQNVNDQSGYVRHTLFEGFVTRQKGMNAGSPGAAFAFQPDRSQMGAKPWILVSGDATQRAHVLKPTTLEASSWSYDKEDIVDTGSTVGQSAVADLDGDGLVEVLVPAYDKDTIYVLSFRPAN